MLCTSCRRQLSRGADYCGTCGTPVASATPAARARARRRDARAARRRHDDRARAGQHRRARRPERLARARAHLARRQRRRGQHRGRRVERGHARRRRRDHVRDAAPRRRRSCRSAGRRCASSAAATGPRPAARSSSSPARACVVPALGPTGVAAAATQFGMKPRVRSGYALKRLDASEGSKRWVLKDLNRNTFLRLSDNDAHLFELLDGTHSLSDLIGIAEQRFGSAGAPRLARLLADLGERGYLAGVAGSERDRGRAAGVLPQAVQAAREDRHRARRLVRQAVPQGRLGAVHEARAVRDRGADRGRARRVRLPRSSAATARRSSSPSGSGSARSSSCSGASPWWPCTRRRTGSRWRRTGARSTAPG